MKILTCMLFLVGCGGPCDAFIDKFCVFAKACGSVLAHGDCVIQSKQAIKELKVTDEQCADKVDDLDRATCAATFGNPPRASAGYLPPR